MAKKKAKLKPNVKKFLAELGTDPNKLGRFILDPETVMNEAKIAKQDREDVRKAMALAVHHKLKAVPEAYLVMFC